MFKSIEKEGLTEGKLLVDFEKKKFKTGHQWLTKNQDFTQSWNEHSSLPYDRTAVRLRIEIPDNPARYLFKWTKHGERMAGAEVYEMLSCYGDPENWYIFKGNIKPDWIKEIRVKPIVSKLW